MSDDELPVYIIPEFSSSSSSSSSSGGFEFLASVALAALEEDTASSSANSRRYIWRDRYSAHERLMNMYFVDEPMFEDDVFRQRYRMSRRLFLKIVEDITAAFSWFRSSVSAAGIRGFSAIQKCMCALRQLAYGNLADNYDEGLSFSTRTARECLDNFCIAIKYLYGKEYLRSPTSHDVACLYEAHEARHHFPGMIGSIDWDGIYPPWSCFLKAYAYPVARKEKVLKNLQESARKDVERAFGHLKNKWAIIERPARMRDKEKIINAVYTCVILHNMILKDDGNTISPVYIRDTPNDIRATDPNFLYRLHNKETHYMLRRDITEHVGDLDIDV
uniref:uncharacterized protein LOC122610403 n=1 Tax=Erigeron canadensis TaxID=72917 RepID=UPI001CB931B0|nr:uncharacterized protein LOC122610403 [Erigeron canadensis]